MKKYKLSISIVSYNNANEISLLLKELVRNIHKSIRYRIFIINNSQSERIENLEKISPRIKTVQLERNVGFGAGHNVILGLIDSDYHVILNPDIRIIKDPFYKILRYIDNQPNVGMVAPLIVDESGVLQRTYRRQLTVVDVLVRHLFTSLFKQRYYYHTMSEQTRNKPFDCEFVQGSFVVIRTKILKKIHGFDERYFMYVEDADLCRRVSNIQHVVVFPGVKVIHKWRKGSRKKISLMRLHVISLIRYFNKWGWKLA